MPVELHHRQSGEPATDGSSPIIAIHGLFGSLENLGVITRQLSEDYFVYALDLPNHGRSEHIEYATLSVFADAVIDWMAANNIPKAHFLGHSLGGKVSMEIALRYPEKVDKIIVADIAPVGYSRRHQDVFDAFRAVDLESIKTRLDADKQMQPHVPELSTRSFLLKNLEKGDNGWFWRINLEGLIADYDEFIAPNIGTTDPFDGDVLFIKGELSSYILPEHKEPILKLFPNASVKVISKTNHWLHAEKPDIFTGIVQRFLSSVG